MDEHTQFILMAHATREPLDFVRAFVPLTLASSLEGNVIKTLFLLGITYHQPLELPDTSNLNWQKTVIRCLESLQSRVGIPPVTMMVPPPAAMMAPPPAAPILSPVPAPRKCPPVPAPRKCLQCPLLASALQCPLLASASSARSSQVPPVPAPRKCPPVPAPHKCLQCPLLASASSARSSQVPSSARSSQVPSSARSSQVPPVETFRFLGTTISQDLKWDNHIVSIVRKAQQRLYFLRQLRKFNLPQELLKQFYSAIIESVLCTSITVWFSSATKSDLRRLRRVVRTAERIIGTTLPTLQELYLSRVSKRAGKITLDPSHPAHSLFELLPSGRRYRALSTRTTRHRNSFFPQAIHLMNT